MLPAQVHAGVHENAESSDAGDPAANDQTPKGGNKFLGISSGDLPPPKTCGKPSKKVFLDVFSPSEFKFKAHLGGKDVYRKNFHIIII